ncbi:MAG: glycosyltransferase family 4 protein [Chloroflexi bacterium]|nr:glycosyltransferase family 4 protein [Chloroflexota bacterium]
MRIGIDYTAAIKQHGGIGRFVRGLIDGLADVDQDNEYVLVYFRRGEGMVNIPVPQRTNFRERQIPIPDRVMAILWHRFSLPIPVDLATGQVDVFHAPDFVLPPLRHGASVLTVHDLSFLLHPECHEDSLNSYLEKAVPHSVARADFITADSLNTRKELICLMDADPDRVEVVYGGVEERFRPMNAEGELLSATRRRLGIDYPFILNVGVIEPRKNLVTLVQAYERLKSRLGFRHKLLIAGGKGWLWDDVFRKVRDLNLDDDVVFAGYVPEADLPALYNLADLFVYPSLYEGFGLPVAEAMACGTPVVTSNTSSLPEIVGEAGLMVAPTEVEALADSIERALTDAALRDRMRVAGLAQSAKFTWQKAAKSLVGVYQKAAAHGHN